MNKEIIWLCAAQLVDYFAKNHKIHNLYVNVVEYGWFYSMNFVHVFYNTTNMFSIHVNKKDLIGESTMEKWESELDLFVKY